MTESETLELVESAVHNFNDLMRQQYPGYTATPHQINLTTLVYAIIKTLNDAGEIEIVSDTCSICNAPSINTVCGKGLCVQHAQDYEYFHKYEYNLEDGDFQEVLADWIEEKREDLFG